MNDSFELIGLGELLWDCFPDKRLPGGAPANVAFHAQQLGLRAAVASRVGTDELGDEICSFLVSQGLSTDLIQRDSTRSTGTVTVSPQTETGVHYTFLENSAWDGLEAQPELMEAVRECRSICFGTLAQRRSSSRHTIHRCLQNAARDCLIVYDVNLRPPFVNKEWIEKSVEVAKVIKLNDDEVNVLAPMLDFSTSDQIRFAKGLLDRYRQLELVSITRGACGCVGVTCDEIVELPGNPIEVADTVGAGDAFTAAMIFGRLQNWPLAKTYDLANRYGALVASRPGAMPALSDEVATMQSEIDWAFRETPRI